MKTMKTKSRQVQTNENIHRNYIGTLKIKEIEKYKENISIIRIHS